MLLSQKNFMYFMIVFVVAIHLITSFIALAGSPDVKAAKMHIQAMVQEAEQMMSHGNQGHLDIMISHAESMISHAKEAIDATPTDNMHGKEALAHMKEAIGHAEEAISRARKGHGDAAMAHANKAMSHARQGARHADEM